MSSHLAGYVLAGYVLALAAVPGVLSAVGFMAFEPSGVNVNPALGLASTIVTALATIGLAASKNVYGVILGGLVGHAFCTGLAVIGGKIMAAKISPRTIGYVGGVTFLCFGVIVFF